MIDIRLLRDDPTGVRASLIRRGVSGSQVDELIDTDRNFRESVLARDEVRAELNLLSKSVEAAYKSKEIDRANELRGKAKDLGDRLSELEHTCTTVENRRKELLLYIPNIPDDNVPDGDSDQDNVPIRYWHKDLGEVAPEDFTLPPFPESTRVPHWEIGSELGILDLERATKLSGAMFPMFRGPGSRMIRALTSFALDIHCDESSGHPYEEVRPPTMVRTETMVSTGHLPKFADDAYHLERDSLWAIPTAEVPLTSMYRDEIVDESFLPKRLTAFTACFRREAGSAGRDTRGLLRLHEFDKVEILAYATADQAQELHREILAKAEELLRLLGITYRVVDLCTGDLGNSSKRTFDLEAYSPGTDKWLEVSSVSWFGDYQARRANLRYRKADGTGVEFCHTLNGSALAWARIWAILVEIGRQADGSVVLPGVLAPYLGGKTTIDAKTSRLV